MFFLTASFTTDQLNNISSPSLRHKELQQSADLHIVKLSIVAITLQIPTIITAFYL